MAESIEMSRQQINFNNFRAIFSGEEFPHGNRRPVQPLNGRTVLTDLKGGNHWRLDKLLNTPPFKEYRSYFNAKAFLKNWKPAEPKPTDG